jgi:hypothetical protein
VTPEERMMEVAKLRLRLHMNSRLRLELLSAISKLFREYQEPLKEEVLSSLVFAVSDELMGETSGVFGEGVMGNMTPPSHPGLEECPADSIEPRTPPSHPPSSPPLDVRPGSPESKPSATPTTAPRRARDAASSKKSTRRRRK